MNNLEIIKNNKKINNLTISEEDAYKEIAKIFLAEKRFAYNTKINIQYTTNGKVLHITQKCKNIGKDAYIYQYTFENLTIL